MPRTDRNDVVANGAFWPKRACVAAFGDLARRPNGNVPSLDVLRTAAILLVLSLHVGEFFPERIQNWPPVLFGWTGVDLFFVLSGFLIGSQLWRELRDRGTVAVGQFILRRGFRIWPLYYTFIVVVGGVAILRSKPLDGFLADIFCVSNYFHHRIAGGWSLSTEEQFYLTIPVLLFLGSRFVHSAKLVVLPIAWLVALPAIRWSVLHANPSANLYFPLYTHSDGLPAGLIIAWMAVNRPKWLNCSLLSSSLTLIAGVGLGIFLRRADQVLFRFTSLALLYGSATLFVLRAKHLPGIVSWHGFYICSRLSYGMYLNQFHVVDAIPGVQKIFGAGAVGFAAAWTLSLIGSLAFAFVTFAIVEVPFLRMRQRRLKKAGPAAGLTAEK